MAERSVQTADRLALEGGPRAVTLPPGDRWAAVGEEEVAAVAETLRGGDVYAPTAHFEREFAAFTGARHALALCNGTAAIHAALFACGVGAGDEVIVPSYTWHASISPILHCEGTPVFCEVDPETYTADPADVARRITDRTRAVVVTHVLGNPADMDGLLAVTRPRGIRVVEDASHAHGATFGAGTPAGPSPGEPPRHREPGPARLLADHPRGPGPAVAGTGGRRLWQGGGAGPPPETVTG